MSDYDEGIRRFRALLDENIDPTVLILIYCVWVENGILPPPPSRFEFNGGLFYRKDGRTKLPDS